MKIFVIAKAGAKRASIEEIDATYFIISVREPATDNRANIAILKALAWHLGMPSSALSIASGMASCRKVFAVKQAGGAVLP